MPRELQGKPQDEDERLREAVRDAIRDYVERERVHVAVSVRDGVAVLQGVVDSLDQRERIGRLARSAPGIRGVENLLVIGMDAHAGDEGTGKEIARRLADSPADDLGVEVRRGVARIVGKAESLAEIEAAREIAERTEGVRDVVVDANVGYWPGPARDTSPIDERPLKGVDRPDHSPTVADPRDVAVTNEANRRLAAIAGAEDLGALCRGGVLVIHGRLRAPATWERVHDALASIPGVRAIRREGEHERR